MIHIANSVFQTYCFWWGMMGMRVGQIVNIKGLQQLGLQLLFGLAVTILLYMHEVAPAIHKVDVMFATRPSGVLNHDSWCCNQCWSGIVFFSYHPGIYNENFTVLDTSRVWLYFDNLVFNTIQVYIPCTNLHTSAESL